MPKRSMVQRIPRGVRRALPFLRWFHAYTPGKLRTDFVAGVTVALVLIPQSMAYAQLAGLPVYYGLYAAFLPPTIAVMFGSSFQLATGPTAIASLLTAASLAPMVAPGTSTYIAYAMMLALLVGMWRCAFGVFKLGSIVNLLSRPVLNGFTNAAALIIATSQISKIFGVNVDSRGRHYQTVLYVIHCAMRYTHWPTFGMAALALVVMIGLRRLSPKLPFVLIAVVITTILSAATGFEEETTAPVTRLDPAPVRQEIAQFNATLAELRQLNQEQMELTARLKAVRSKRHRVTIEEIKWSFDEEYSELHASEDMEKLWDLRQALRSHLFHRVKNASGESRFVSVDPSLCTLRAWQEVWRLRVRNNRLDPDAIVLRGGGAIVGHIPEGLPHFGVPRLDFSIVPHLVVPALVIALLSFMEAISIAKAMATRTRQDVDANQELIGQGLANIAGAFAQSYPTSGSFSRSMVNLQCGAATGLSSVFSSGVVAVILLFFTPLLYHLPQSVLAAIIVMAVLSLLNVRGLVHHWKASRSCGIIAVITFVATLFFAPHLEWGILIGIILALVSFLLRYMRPRITLLSRHPEGSYRDAQRHGLVLCRRVAVIRFNGPLFFASSFYLEEAIIERVAAMPHVRHIILVGNGINLIDATGESMLSELVRRLRAAGYDLSICGLNDSARDALRRTGLYARIGEDHFFRNVDTAVHALYASTHEGTVERDCPLLQPVLQVPVVPG